MPFCKWNSLYKIVLWRITITDWTFVVGCWWLVRIVSNEQSGGSKLKLKQGKEGWPVKTKQQWGNNIQIVLFKLKICKTFRLDILSPKFKLSLVFCSFQRVFLAVLLYFACLRPCLGGFNCLFKCDRGFTNEIDC